MKRINEITIIVGLWLIAAPFLLRYVAVQRSVSSTDIAVGALLILASLWTRFEEMGRLEVTAFEVICGGWLMAAPFLLHSRRVPHVLFNHLAVGAIVLIGGLIQLSSLVHRQRHAS